MPLDNRSVHYERGDPSGRETKEDEPSGGEEEGKEEEEGESVILAKSRLF